MRDNTKSIIFSKIRAGLTQPFISTNENLPMKNKGLPELSLPVRGFGQKMYSSNAFFGLILCVASGLLAGLSFNISSLSFLIWFSLVPFIYVTARSSFKQGLLYSFIFGLVYYFTVIYWVVHVTFVGLVVLVFYLSLYPAVFFILARYFLKRPLNLVTLPCIWVMTEALKENIWCGLGWANVGYSQYQRLYLIQSTDILGIKFISFLVLLVNTMIYEFVSGKKFIIRKIATVFFIIGLSVLYSFYKMNTLREINSVDMTLVQPNFNESLKQDKNEHSYMQEKLRALGIESSKGSLVIFPEASWPNIFKEDDLPQLKSAVKAIDRNILTGVVVKEGNNFYNSALLLDNNGTLIDTYRKIKLVPFGEYVPLRSYLTFISALNNIGDISRGSIYKIFPFRGKYFSVLICFEDIFPQFVSRFSTASDFIINITNDAWFKGEPQASQHLAIMVARAIENRISIARCANSGITGWANFKGEVSKLSVQGRSVFCEGVLNTKLPILKKVSFYNKFPEIFPILCGLTMLVIFFTNGK